ncbi:hypothetical protein LTR56_026644 [Elasticomyces elasticus]|nr:hypothetical protein LTR22_027725 [Elasticomyces elasticus]KAK3615346.1 hypothetical protein LTR56_026644 [Elasticomyces elasticus]KAK4901396.1 hypothetical protein LTR49_027301 [Elasticomyces elasticus]KAK5732353.1 hypothetical protein LTS12_027138 [Elasticomyces elasticus]
MAIRISGALPYSPIESWPSAHAGAGPLNINRGWGAQRNYTLSGGSDNQQFNADVIHYTKHHVPLERAETPPLPSSTIPFLRDLDFVERAELDLLQDKLFSKGARLALVGLGGVGKSQIAIEYGYRLREHSPDTWVLWVHASNAARFDESVRKLADDVKIYGRHNVKADIFQLVYDWLRDERKGQWVLVLDNADDASFLLQPPDTGGSRGSSERGRATNRARIDYFPICAHGSMITTSRNRAVASKLVDECDTVDVQPMDNTHAVALLEKKLGQQGDQAVVKKLVAALEYMPLAIAQAAAYIKRRGPRCSVEQYLIQLERSDKSKTSLLNANSEELRRDREAKNSIILTWQISFEHICQSRQSAADLLSVMSFYDHQGIPESLLQVEGAIERTCRHGSTQTPSDAGDEADESSDTAADEAFEDDLATLRDYLFISVAPGGSTFEMHRLVQFAARKWLESRGELQRWAAHSIGKLDKVLPDGRYENWPECRMLYPHARLVLHVQPSSRDALVQWSSVLFKAAWFAAEQGEYVAAEAMNRRALEGREKALGKEHPSTLKSVSNLASVLQEQGKYEAAEAMNRRALESREKALGEEHPSTLMSVENLALVLQYQGKYEVAEAMNRRALEGREKALGKEHPDTLTSVNNLAMLLHYRAKYEAAEEMNRRALEGLEKALGKEHPDTLRSVSNLAMVLQVQGKYEAAQEMNRRALEGREKAFGKEHPDTLMSVSNLAWVLQEQGKYETAELMNRRALEGLEKALGKEHPSTLMSVSNLALVLQYQGKYEAAEAMNRRALQGGRRR